MLYCLSVPPFRSRDKWVCGSGQVFIWGGGGMTWVHAHLAPSLSLPSSLSFCPRDPCMDAGSSVVQWVCGRVHPLSPVPPGGRNGVPQPPPVARRDVRLLPHGPSGRRQQERPAAPRRRGEQGRRYRRVRLENHSKGESEGHVRTMPKPTRIRFPREIKVTAFRRSTAYGPERISPAATHAPPCD